MKAKYFLLAAALGALGLTACTKEYYTQEVTNIQGTLLQSADFSINKWYLDEEYGLYYAVLNVPQITQTVLDKGTVQVVTKYEDNTWTPLPIVRANSVEAEDGGDYLFSTYIDYEWTVGKVTIFVTATDFYTGDAPETMYFRVNILS
ncbi:MAG: hypothetical protein J6M31_07230 [Bacteroidales bacterium]|nr:hypothetical protein [Bacteroidales bacterium]